MYKNYIIRKALAALMLLTFAFSATPKILLHNLVADHRDTPVYSDCTGKDLVAKAGFNCNCDNLVVESPFINNSYVPQIKVEKQFNEKLSYLQLHFKSVNYFYFELRGPPSC